MHDHGHPHEHAHGEHAHDEHHHPHTDPHNPHAGQGPVVLDIGGDIGALIVTMPDSMAGVEIGIRPEKSLLTHNEHVAVVGRPTGQTTSFAAVFGEVTAGRYELYRRPAGPVELTAQVEGGMVTQLRWPVEACAQV